MEFNKTFTLAEAEKTLPYVKRIVADILATAAEIRIKRQKTDDPEMAREATGDLIEKLGSYLQEISEIGCFFKDWNFEIGLVDFPAVIDNEFVFLCWRSDEENIEYYHPVDAGYRGRKRIKKSPARGL